MLKHQNKKLKRDILRGVFENNRDFDKRCTANAQTHRKRLSKQFSWLFPLALLSILFFWQTTIFSFEHKAPTDTSTIAIKPREIKSESKIAWDEILFSPQPSKAIEPQEYSRLFQTDRARLTAIFGLELVKRIVIDPGHGGKDPGAVGPTGLKEKDLALDIGLRLKQRLKNGNEFEVFMTRDSDEFLSLPKRVEFANAKKSDLFISIHINSLPQEPLNIIETYFFGPPTNPKTFMTAEEENKGSQYLLEDFKAVVKKIGDTLKSQESAALAESIQLSLYSNMRKFDSKIKDMGVNTAPFVVLLGIDSPCILVEVSCITNKREEEMLKKSAYREKIASFLERGITRYVNMRKNHAKGGMQHGAKTDG